MTPEEIFGRQLKNIRKEKKVTQEALGKAVGVHTGTVSHWENGKQLPDTSTIRKIADYLGVTLGELLNGTGCKPSYSLAEKIIDFGVLKQKSFDDCQHIAVAILNGCDTYK